MTKLLIIQNISREAPGLLLGVLKDKNISFDVIDLDQGQQLPSLAEYSALVVLGGPDSANDDTPKMINELALIKEALDTGIPYLGICLGMQAIVKVAGGKVVPGMQKEIGFLGPDGMQSTVELTEAGKIDPLLAGLDNRLLPQLSLASVI